MKSPNDAKNRLTKLKARLKKKVQKEDVKNAMKSVLLQGIDTSENKNLISSKHADTLLGRTEVFTEIFQGSASAPRLKQIEDKAQALIQTLSKHCPGLSLSQRETLEYILNSCLARIHYNNTYINFYKNQTDKDIEIHLKTVFNFNGLITKSFAKEMKENRSSGAEDDTKLYIDLILLIEKHLSVHEDTVSSALFDVIHEYSSKESLLIKEDEDLVKQIKDMGGQAAGYVVAEQETREYQAGRELPHLEEITKLSESYLSKKYCRVMKCMELQYFDGGFVYSPTDDFGKFFEEIKQKSKTHLEQLAVIQESAENEKLLKETQVILQKLRVVLNLSCGDKTSLFKAYGSPRQVFDKLFDLNNQVEINLSKIRTQLANNSVSTTVIASISDNKSTTEEVKLSVDSKVEELKEVATKTIDSGLGTIPQHVKDYVKSSLTLYEQQRDDSKILGLVENKEKKENGLSNPHLSLLARVLYDKKTLLKVFNPQMLLKKIKLGELLNLVLAMKGKVINQSGSRFRPMLNNCLGDTDMVSIPALHKPHGGDIRNDDVTNLTIELFKDLFERANVKATYGSQLEDFLKNEGLQINTSSSSGSKKGTVKK